MNTVGMLELSGNLVSSFLDHVWQSSVFALFVLLILVLLRRAPARIRYALWVAIPLKFLVPSALLTGLVTLAGLDLSSTFVSVAWAFGDPLAFARGQSAALHTPSALVRELPSSFQIVFAAGLGVWIAGALVLLGLWIFRQARLYYEIRHAARLREGREARIVQQLAGRFGIQRKIQIVTSPDFTEIGVWGVWRPWILLPENISGHLSDSEMEAILMHELIHVARWDNLLGHISMGACCFFWFHPLLWFADRRIVSERERVCDDRVLELGSACRTYAAGLVKVLRHGIGFRVAGFSCAGGAHLKRRIEQIASGEPLPPASFVHRLAVSLVLVLLLLVSLASVRVDRTQVDPAYRKPAKGCTESRA